MCLFTPFTLLLHLLVSPTTHRLAISFQWLAWEEALWSYTCVYRRSTLLWAHGCVTSYMATSSGQKGNPNCSSGKTPDMLPPCPCPHFPNLLKIMTQYTQVPSSSNMVKPPFSPFLTKLYKLRLAFLNILCFMGKILRSSSIGTRNINDDNYNSHYYCFDCCCYPTLSKRLRTYSWYFSLQGYVLVGSRWTLQCWIYFLR